MKVALFGDGLWATLALERLVQEPHEIIGVGLRARPTEETFPQAAARLASRVWRGPDVNDPAFLDELRALHPDVILSISFNRIFRRPLLDLPPAGCLNVHAGDLPRYRGRSVLYWALVNGEPEIGLTVHKMVEEIDAGPILLQERIRVSSDDDLGTILPLLAARVPDLVARALDLLARGEASFRPQSGLSSYYPRRRPGDEIIEWAAPTRNVWNLIRALTRPGPGALTTWEGTALRVWKARLVEGIEEYRAAPGSVVRVREGRPWVKTGDTLLELDQWTAPDGSMPSIRTGQRLGGRRSTVRPAEPSTFPPRATIREAMAAVHAGGTGLALMQDGTGPLLGIVADYDLRRALLEGRGLDDPVAEIVNRNPATAPVHAAPSEILTFMRHRQVDHLPLVDEIGRAVGIAIASDLAQHDPVPIPVLILAGGRGERLRPLTDETPKPMLPVGGQPLLEDIISQLTLHGVRRIYLAVGYKSDRIRAHLGEGERFGVRLVYLEEPEPLGTAGPLRLLPGLLKEPILVVNGDLYTRVDYARIYAMHQERAAAATVGVIPREVRMPYGVIDVIGEQVVAVREKPSLTVFANAGIYILSPEVVRLLPPEGRFDMPDLLREALRQGMRIVPFPVLEQWIDIGRPRDYEAAQEATRSHS